MEPITTKAPLPNMCHLVSFCVKEESYASRWHGSAFFLWVPLGGYQERAKCEEGRHMMDSRTLCRRASLKRHVPNFEVWFLIWMSGNMLPIS